MTRLHPNNNRIPLFMLATPSAFSALQDSPRRRNCLPSPLLNNLIKQKKKCHFLPGSQKQSCGGKEGTRHQPRIPRRARKGPCPQPAAVALLCPRWRQQGAQPVPRCQQGLGAPLCPFLAELGRFQQFSKLYEKGSSFFPLGDQTARPRTQGSSGGSRISPYPHREPAGNTWNVRTRGSVVVAKPPSKMPHCHTGTKFISFPSEAGSAPGAPRRPLPRLPGLLRAAPAAPCPRKGMRLSPRVLQGPGLSGLVYLTRGESCS